MYTLPKIGTAVPPPPHEWQTVWRDPPQLEHPRRSPSLHLVQKHSTYPLPPQVSHSRPCGSLSFICEKSLYPNQNTPAQSTMEAYSDRCVRDETESIDASEVPEKLLHTFSVFGWVCLSSLTSTGEFPRILWPGNPLPRLNTQGLTRKRGAQPMLHLWFFKKVFSILLAWHKCPRQPKITLWLSPGIQNQRYGSLELVDSLKGTCTINNKGNLLTTK